MYPPPPVSAAPNRGAKIGTLIALAVFVIATVIAVVLFATGESAGSPAKNDAKPATVTAPDPKMVKRINDIICLPLTYDLSNIEASKQAALKVLTGDAKSQYETSIESVTKQLADKSGHVDCTVNTVGISSQTATEVTALVFTTSTSTVIAESATPMNFEVTLTPENGTWLIRNLVPLSGLSYTEGGPR